jgi:hypothetical protein
MLAFHNHSQPALSIPPSSSLLLAGLFSNSLRFESQASPFKTPTISNRA